MLPALRINQDSTSKYFLVKPKLMKDCSCLTRMINSVMSLTKKNTISKPPNIQELSRFRDQTRGSQQKKDKCQIDAKKSILNQSKQNKSLNIDKSGQSKLQSQHERLFGVSIRQKQIASSIPQEKLDAKGQSHHQEQIIQETQRDFIQGSDQESIHNQSAEDDLPTEKSEIIMNDIGKDIDHNQNNFLFNSVEDEFSSFSEVYEKIRLIKTFSIYEEYLVKKKTTNELRQAFIMRSYQSFLEEWNLSEDEESIEKYSNIYEREKHHIKNLTILEKNTCRHLTKLIDYELKPPTINPNLNNAFTSGSVVAVFEKIETTLEDYLNNQNNFLSHADKKKIINQMCAFLNDVHQQNLTLKDLSLSTFKLDQFGNVKATSLQIEEFESKFYDCENALNERELVYLAPQELESRVKQNKKIEDKTFFHSGFSQISDFDKNESTVDKLDLWRLGIILAKILTGRFLFNENTSQQQRTKILATLETEDSLNTSKLNVQLDRLTQKQIKILQTLLRKNPNERASCKEILQSEYLKNILEDSRQQLSEQKKNEQQ